MRRRVGLTALLFAVWAVTLAGCGSEEQKIDESLRVDNTEPLGSVGGVVLNGVTEAPIVGGVEVTVIAGGHEPFTVTTDADGRFLVQEVPASGNVVVLLEAEGFLPTRLTGELDGEAGNFPVGNATLSIGPIGLVPATGTVSVRIVGENGDVIPDISLTGTTFVRYMDLSNGERMERGQVTVSATSNQAGLATFSGLPDFAGLGAEVNDTMMVTVPPVDYNDDGIYEYPGTTVWLNGLRTGGPERLITLNSGYATNLTVLSSTIAALEGMGGVPSTVPVNGPIYVLFNLPINEASLYVRVMDEFGENTMQVNTSVDGQLLTIDFPTALQAGAEYNMQIHAVSMVGDTILETDLFAPFFTASTETLAISAMEDDPNSNDVIVYFNQPVGTGNTATNELYGANCVLWYNIDIDTGDTSTVDPGEYGADTCDIGGGAIRGLRADEGVPDMPGASRSGYTTRWRFQPPLTGGGTPGPLPGTTEFKITFPDVSQPSRLVTTPDGVIAPTVDGWTVGGQPM